MWNFIKCVLPRITVLLLSIIVLLTCGCQPTPEKTAVVYGGGLEDKIENAASSITAYSVPAIWQEMLDMKGSDTKIEINASISIPNVTAVPVYKVKPATFNDTRIQSLVDCFAKGRDVIKETEPTKAELEKQLILAKKYNDEEMVAEFEKMIAAAPETVEAEKITDWNVDQSPAGSFLADDGEYAGISVSPDTFVYMNGYIETERVSLLNDKGRIGEAAISGEAAIAAAQSMLYEIGVDYMVADSWEKAQRYACLSGGNFAEYSEEPISKGYFIKFARNIDGIPAITNNGVSFYIAEEFDYKAPLNPEEIQIYVEETGIIQSFVWREPLEIEDKMADNVSLMPFEDMKQRIRDMMTFINSYHSFPTKVTNIKMNMTIVDVKDHPEEVMYVPAWFVHYTQEIGENLQEDYMLVLNAIDGGRVLELPTDISPAIQAQMDKET